MLRVILVLLAVLAGANAKSALTRLPSLDGRIVGGEDTTVEAYPHQVSVRIFGLHTCGGSILNSKTVLTAAHCVIFPNLPIFTTVQYGVSVTGGIRNVIPAIRAVMHENYNSSTVDYDIALIFLLRSIPFGPTAQPIALATSTPAAGSKAVVTGWGNTKENGVSSTVLQMTEVDIVDSQVCREQYLNVNEITDRMLCAGVSGGGKGPCNDDSGGALIINNTQVGVVSWSVGCARPRYPTVYTNVAYLRPWIRQHTN